MKIHVVGVPNLKCCVIIMIESRIVERRTLAHGYLDQQHGGTDQHNHAMTLLKQEQAQEGPNCKSSSNNTR